MCALTIHNEPEPDMADVLIVGQGIAGSLLGWVLHKRGLRVLLVDDGHKSSASVVAAGMINPVQGQRLNTIWEIEHCLPAALALYSELEAHFNKRFFHPKKIVRVLKDAAQAEILQTRLADPSFAPYITAVYPPDTNTQICSAANTPPVTAAAANTLCAPYGSFEISGGGYLDTQALLCTLRDFFLNEGILTEAALCYADLNLSNPSAVCWQMHRARRVIFAEGWRVLDNPFFAAYRFLATKGQILSVQTAAPLPDYVVNQGKWLVPQAEREAWIGATFERGITNIEVTASARAEILADVQALIPHNALSVSAQRAGIRLATPDSIPRIGFLPAEPRIGIFSAFGSKGNCFAPYLAHCMAEHICNASALPPRADIALKKVHAPDTGH